MVLRKSKKLVRERGLEMLKCQNKKEDVAALAEDVMDCEDNTEEDEEDTLNDDKETINEPSAENIEEDATEDISQQRNKSGVLYFSSIPPRFTPRRLQEYFEKYAPGMVGRVFLEKNKYTKSRDHRFNEGWLEITRKKLAKRIAEEVDNKPVGGKKRDPASCALWNIKYLSGFKWVHLVEQLEYEKSSHTRRMTAEINQARRIAAHFEEQVEKGENLKKLEKKVQAQGGNWETTHQRHITQKQTLKRRERAKAKEGDLMSMIFTD